MNPIEFQQKWIGVELKQRSASQEHFLDICRVIEHSTPADMDPTGDTFTFERGASKAMGWNGWADVWYRGHFARKYKGPHKDLVKAYDQCTPAYRAATLPLIGSRRLSAVEIARHHPAS